MLALALALALADAPSPTGGAVALAPPSTPAATHVEVDRRRVRVQLAGMGVLTGWAAANLIGGAIGNLVVPVGRDARYFHQANWAWNTVNLTLGAIGLRSARRERPGAAGPRQVDAAITRAQRVFAVNALLDVGYVVGGYTTWEIGKDRESARVRGYGEAVIFQGAFLLAFDLAMILAHETGARRLERAPVLAPIAGPVQGLALGGRF